MLTSRQKTLCSKDQLFVKPLFQHQPPHSASKDVLLQKLPGYYFFDFGFLAGGSAASASSLDFFLFFPFSAFGFGAGSSGGG